jgi:REP element-mobilizing transposase RayT
VSQSKIVVKGRLHLHLVLVNEGRFRVVDEERIASLHSTITRTARKRKHLLAEARILADHIHLMIGCGIEESPSNVALAYMNNISFAEDMRPVLQSGFYAGTFGNYDLGAIRNAL